MQVGFVGLGRMGQIMVQRLLAAGFCVTVWNRTQERAQPLLDQGATLATSLPSLATASNLVFTIVTDDAAVETIYDPLQGLLAGDVAGTLFVEMSTIRPDTIRTLSAMVLERGATLLDSPVSGTVGPAREGKLMALVGGDPEDVERARPALETFCRRIAHLGPNGSGTTMKLVLNMPMAIYWQGLCEALTMGVQAGLDMRQMLELIADSPACIGALPVKIPAILEPSDEVGFDITGVRKDLLAIIATGQMLGVPMPAGSATLVSFAAATGANWGDRDLAELIRYYITMVQNTNT